MLEQTDFLCAPFTVVTVARCPGRWFQWASPHSEQVIPRFEFHLSRAGMLVLTWVLLMSETWGHFSAPFLLGMSLHFWIAAALDDCLGWRCPKQQVVAAILNFPKVCGIKFVFKQALSCSCHHHNESVFWVVFFNVQVKGGSSADLPCATWVCCFLLAWGWVQRPLGLEQNGTVCSCLKQLSMKMSIGLIWVWKNAWNSCLDEGKRVEFRSKPWTGNL